MSSSVTTRRPSRRSRRCHPEDRQKSRMASKCLAGLDAASLPLHNLAPMNVGTRLWVWWFGELVGTDQYGNTYYRQKNWRLTEKGAGKFSRERRWVVYAGETEGSKVP